ncbi:hypothetical protein XA68_12597 [Ophiocordyceps unilateralis]|uniref:F-box domain-containing protein n=1 Tax=Ophiocordyceps unilateralis TaxID=268505 RepID=A0A2A9PED1_OPHUN|nr:hypothetical protein XA68_12597 [Ophiocordyceps unilateralis]
MATTSSALGQHDLLLCILDLLSFPDLVSLSMVNKFSRYVTEPRLYATVEAAWALESTPSASLLLRTLLDRPELSGCVRHLRLVGHGFHHDDDDDDAVNEPPARRLDSDCLTKASAFILSTGVPFANFWIHELESGTADAVVATLLATMSNLQSLHLDPNFTVRCRILGKLFHSSLIEASEHHQLPAFPNLRRVTFSPRYNQHLQLFANNTSDVLPLFHLRNLQQLSVSIDNPFHFAWPGTRPKPSHLESLEVFRLREAPLLSLLTPLQKLRKLHWHWFYQPHLDEGLSTNIIQLDVMTQAFKQVSHTLTDLTIEAEAPRSCTMAGHYYQSLPLELWGSLGDMVHLRALRRLSLPWVFLMGFSESSTKCPQLPLSTSLEVLTLTGDLADNEQWEWCHDSILSAIKSTLDFWHRPLSSSLRRIVLPIPLGCGQLTDGREKELQDIGASAGLELGWKR